MEQVGSTVLTKFTGQSLETYFSNPQDLQVNSRESNPLYRRLNIDVSPSSSVVFTFCTSAEDYDRRSFSLIRIGTVEELKVTLNVSCGSFTASGSTVVGPRLSSAIITLDKNIEKFIPIFVGEINGTTLNVTSIIQGEISAGISISSQSTLSAGTVITGYGTGTGGIGTYTINIGQTRPPARYTGSNLSVSGTVELSSVNSRVFGDQTTKWFSMGGGRSQIIESFITVPKIASFIGKTQDALFSFLDSQELKSSVISKASLNFLQPTFLASEISSSVRVTNSRLSIINAAQVAGLTAEADDNVITKNNHGFDIGEPIIFVSLTGGVGLTENVVYWVISSGFTANTFRVSTSFGGSQVDITTDYTDMVAESRLREVLFSFRGSATATAVGQIEGGVLLSVQAASSVLSSGSLNYDYAISAQITATSLSEPYLRVVAPTSIQAESTIVSFGSGNLLVESRVSGIPIYINLENRQIVTDQTFVRPVSEIDLTRNDVSAIDVKFVRRGVLSGLSFGSSGRIGIKNQYTGELLAIDSDWTVVESSGGVFYGFSLDLTTLEIQDLFVTGDENFVMAKIEIEWSEAGTINTTLPCAVRIYNDVLK